ncbi:MAG TPA: hypothetical protein VGM50_00770 [Gemmatimonadaceae bacterium]|jgi:hypothetical protein
MHLVACARPQEPLEDAPRSALLADLTEGERWEGFWSLDAYVLRCTKSDGVVEWFKLADDASAPVSPDTRSGKSGEARVLPFRHGRNRLMGRQAVLVAKSPEGRRMLVGTAQRSSRSSTRRTGE